MSFYLFGAPDEKLRLKEFSGSARGGKMVVKIEVETDDPYDFAYALERLGAVQKGQRARPKPEPKRKTATPLALPAPQLALPAPGTGAK